MLAAVAGKPEGGRLDTLAEAELPGAAAPAIGTAAWSAGDYATALQAAGFDWGSQPAASPLVVSRRRREGRATRCGRTILTVSRGPYAKLSRERCQASCWRPWPTFWPSPCWFSLMLIWPVCWPTSWTCSRLGADRRPGRGFGGFLARFLGHTPSFRRFRRINHWGISGLVRSCKTDSSGWANLMTPGVW